MAERLRALIVSCLSYVGVARASDAQASPSATTASTLTAFASEKAETLIRDRLPCLGCHTLNGQGGKLGPELSSVRERRDAAYVARIVSDPQSAVTGTMMPHTPMPNAWRSVVINYLGGTGTGVTSRPLMGVAA